MFYGFLPHYSQGEVDYGCSTIGYLGEVIPLHLRLLLKMDEKFFRNTTQTYARKLFRDAMHGNSSYSFS